MTARAGLWTLLWMNEKGGPDRKNAGYIDERGVSGLITRCF